MAIILVEQPGSAPSDLTDWENSVESLKQYNLGVNNPVDYNFDGNTIKKGVLITIGGSNYYCNSDTAITGTASDYVKITSAGVASYVSSLSGVSWNDTYNFYADSSGNAYIFNEAKAGLTNTVIGAFAEHGYFTEMEVMGIASFESDEIIMYQPVTISDAVTSNNSLTIINTSYGTTNTSGTCTLGLGFSGQQGAQIVNNKRAVNVSDLDLYSEVGYGVPSLGLSLQQTFLYSPKALFIGTTTDNGYKLNVAGGIYATGMIYGTTGIQIHKDGSDTLGVGASMALINSAGNDSVSWQLSANGSMDQWVYSGSAWIRTMRIHRATGNIGINTTTDNGYKLNVAGAASFSGGIKVGASGSTITEISWV